MIHVHELHFALCCSWSGSYSPGGKLESRVEAGACPDLEMAREHDARERGSTCDDKRTAASRAYECRVGRIERGRAQRDLYKYSIFQ